LKTCETYSGTERWSEAGRYTAYAASVMLDDFDIDEGLWAQMWKFVILRWRVDLPPSWLVVVDSISGN
jgi:hypothetical protein